MGCNLRSVHASAPGEIRISSQNLRNCAGYFGSKLFQQVIVAGAILLFYRGVEGRIITGAAHPVPRLRRAERTGRLFRAGKKLLCGCLTTSGEKMTDEKSTVDRIIDVSIDVERTLDRLKETFRDRKYREAVELLTEEQQGEVLAAMTALSELRRGAQCRIRGADGKLERLRRRTRKPGAD